MQNVCKTSTCHQVVVKGKLAKLVRHLALANEIVIAVGWGKRQSGRGWPPRSLRTSLEGDGRLNNLGQNPIPRIIKLLKSF